jgi:hypothetical protein
MVNNFKSTYDKNRGEGGRKKELKCIEIAKKFGFHPFHFDSSTTNIFWNEMNDSSFGDIFLFIEPFDREKLKYMHPRNMNYIMNIDSKIHYISKTSIKNFNGYYVVWGENENGEEINIAIPSKELKPLLNRNGKESVWAILPSKEIGISWPSIYNSFKNYPSFENLLKNNDPLKENI